MGDFRYSISHLIFRADKGQDVLTLYLLPCARVHGVADVMLGSSEKVNMPPTSLRLSNTVTSKPTLRSSFNEANPDGPRCNVSKE